MDEEKKKEPVRAYVENMSADEIVHKVFLKCQLRLDDMSMKLLTIEYVLGGLLFPGEIPPSEQGDWELARDTLFAQLKTQIEYKQALRKQK